MTTRQAFEAAQRRGYITMRPYKPDPTKLTADTPDDSRIVSSLLGQTVITEDSCDALLAACSEYGFGVKWIQPDSTVE